MDASTEFIFVLVLIVGTVVGFVARLKWGYGRNPVAMAVYIIVVLFAAIGFGYLVSLFQGDRTSPKGSAPTVSAYQSSKVSDEGFCNARQLFRAIRRKLGYWNSDFRCKSVDWSDPATLLVVFAAVVLIGGTAIWFAIRTIRGDAFDEW